MYVQLGVIILFDLEKVEMVSELLQKISNWNVISHPNQSLSLMCWVILQNGCFSWLWLSIIFTINSLAVIYLFLFPVSLPFCLSPCIIFLFTTVQVIVCYLLAKFPLYLLSSHFKPFSIHLQNKFSTSFLDLFTFWQ